MMWGARVSLSTTSTLASAGFAQAAGELVGVADRHLRPDLQPVANA
jgi:hypothetical protein